MLVEFEEAVEIAVGAVHPVQRLELGAEHVGEEIDLRLHVAGIESEVVYAVRQSPWNPPKNLLVNHSRSAVLPARNPTHRALAGLGPAIHESVSRAQKFVDARAKPAQSGSKKCGLARIRCRSYIITAMLIGVPKEIKQREYRVGMTPGAVRELVAHGHQRPGRDRRRRRHRSAGRILSRFRRRDRARRRVGLWRDAEMVVKVKEPLHAEYAAAAPGPGSVHLSPSRRRQAARPRR